MRSGNSFAFGEIRVGQQLWARLRRDSTYRILMQANGVDGLLRKFQNMEERSPRPGIRVSNSFSEDEIGVAQQIFRKLLCDPNYRDLMVEHDMRGLLKKFLNMEERIWRPKAAAE